MRAEITLIRQDNRRPGAATTAGFRHVGTPFMATLDADDLWLPRKIEIQASLFESEPGIAGVFSLARLFADGAAPDPNGQGAIRRLWTRTTLLFSTEAARAVGDFVDLPGQLGEVIDWLSRSRDLGQRHALVEEILALRRIRPGSLSYGQDPERSRGYLAAVRASLERKRQMSKRSKPTSV
jgi:glycosyltransferase involved in cell wall biosynthesis